MRPIPPKLREEMNDDPFYHKCARAEFLKDHECEADPVTRRLIEWDHCFTYAGRQINELWAILPVCFYVHRGAGFNKEINQWIALNRATSEDFAKYPKFDWFQRRKYLNSKYGNLSTLA